MHFYIKLLFYVSLVFNALYVLDELVDDRTLLRLTGTDLRLMNIKTGPAYKILEIIEDSSAMVECIVQEDGSIIASESNNCTDEEVSQEIMQKPSCSTDSPQASVSKLIKVFFLTSFMNMYT
ncbi:uncharacterized protein LOC103317781 [Nasonia vitripennis]|uniref:Uncharacterized protein n=1 Tax=Nasonia vitripennis TaxID=7425 RepID=A0A7M7PYH2_NASVI|nr:uncharacterized protein LOC103317781 [Nasonia vitripennis]